MVLILCFAGSLCFPAFSDTSPPPFDLAKIEPCLAELIDMQVEAFVEWGNKWDIPENVARGIFRSEQYGPRLIVHWKAIRWANDARLPGRDFYQYLSDHIAEYSDTDAQIHQTKRKELFQQALVEDGIRLPNSIRPLIEAAVINAPYATDSEMQEATSSTVRSFANKLTLKQIALILEQGFLYARRSGHIKAIGSSNLYQGERTPNAKGYLRDMRQSKREETRFRILVMKNIGYFTHKYRTMVGEASMRDWAARGAAHSLLEVTYRFAESNKLKPQMALLIQDVSFRLAKTLYRVCEKESPGNIYKFIWFDIYQKIHKLVDEYRIEFYEELYPKPQVISSNVVTNTRPTKPSSLSRPLVSRTRQKKNRGKKKKQTHYKQTNESQRNTPVFTPKEITLDERDALIFRLSPNKAFYQRHVRSLARYRSLGREGYQEILSQVAGALQWLEAGIPPQKIPRYKFRTVVRDSGIWEFKPNKDATTRVFIGIGSFGPKLLRIEEDLKGGTGRTKQNEVIVQVVSEWRQLQTEWSQAKEDSE